MLHWIDHSLAIFRQFGDVGLFVLSFIEASFFPIPPYLLSIPMTLAKPQAAFRYATIGVAGSVLGGMLGYAIGYRFGRPILQRFMKHSSIDKMEANFAEYGGWAIALGGVTPIPYKLFTISAGVFRIRMLTFIPASIIARSIRFYIEALFLLLWGRQVVDIMEKILGPVNLLILTALVIGLIILHKTGVMDKYLHPFFQRWQARFVQIGEKLAPIGHFGWYLITGATLTTFGFLVFAKIGEEMLEKEMTRFDAVTGSWINTWKPDWLTGLMKWATAMGSAPFLIAAAVVVTGLGFLLRRRIKDTIVFNICVIGAFVLSETLKYSFHRHRPPFPWLTSATGYSFPSGHALLTMSLYGFLIYLVLRYSHKSAGRNLLIFVLLFLPLLTGISRIYLGVHYPSDVLAGWAVAIGWVGTCVAGRELIRRR